MTKICTFHLMYYNMGFSYNLYLFSVILSWSSDNCLKKEIPKISLLCFSCTPYILIFNVIIIIRVVMVKAKNGV